MDITARMGPESLREVITGGAPGMPASNDLTQADLTALVAFLANPNAGPAAGGPSTDAPQAPGPGPVVGRGGAPSGRNIPPGRAGGMVGPDYPPGLNTPKCGCIRGTA